MTAKRDLRGERKMEEERDDNGDSARLRGNVEHRRRRYVVGGQVHQPRDVLDLSLLLVSNAQMQRSRDQRSSFFRVT